LEKKTEITNLIKWKTNKRKQNNIYKSKYNKKKQNNNYIKQKSNTPI